MRCGSRKISPVIRIASVKPHPISVPLKEVLWAAHEKLKWTWIIASVLLSAGCAQMAGYQSPNPVRPPGKVAGRHEQHRTPHLMALGEGHTMVCE